MTVEAANNRAQYLRRKGLLPGVKKVKIVEGSGNFKYKAIYNDGKITQWGHKDYEDYLQHHDPQRRLNFNTRFAKLIRESYGDPSKKAFWFIVNW